MEQFDFRNPWKEQISHDEWNNFLKHTFSLPDKEIFYNKLMKYLNDNKNEQPFSFTEIGFGQCYDFKKYFKSLHDIGLIKYVGYDITKQFVDFANNDFNNYDFRIGGFYAIKNSDITYTRHVLEHQHPRMGYKFFDLLLQKTNKFSIVIWFIPPAEMEKFHLSKKDGFKHEGAFVNTYSREKIIDIIQKNNFSLEIIDVRTKSRFNQIYIMEKQK